MKICSLRALIALMGLTLLCQTAAAGLLINPKRIVLQDKERNATLDLLNEGDQPARYQIFFEQKVMNQDGAIVNASEDVAKQFNAKDMIRYSPRRIDIKPGGKQAIRLAVRKPKDLPDGEYLSHLVFKEIPNQENSEKDPTKNEDKRLNLAVKPTLKIAIPIIVRNGELNASVDLSQAQIIPDESTHGSVRFQMEREGERSLYGNVEVYEESAGVRGKRVGFARGIALYTMVNQRQVKIPLSEPLSPTSDKLAIEFDEGGQYQGTNYASSKIDL